MPSLTSKKTQHSTEIADGQDPAFHLRHARLLQVAEEGQQTPINPVRIEMTQKHDGTPLIKRTTQTESD